MNPITISNVGNSTAYIDYISVPNLFEMESYDDQDSINPGDSLVIYLYITLPEDPISYGGGYLYLLATLILFTSIFTLMQIDILNWGIMYQIHI